MEDVLIPLLGSMLCLGEGFVSTVLTLSVFITQFHSYLSGSVACLLMHRGTWTFSILYDLSYYCMRYSGRAHGEVGVAQVL